MMFPTNPFPQVFPPSNPFLDHEKVDLYTNPFLTGDCFPVDEKFTTSKQDLVEGLGLDQCDEYNHLFWPEVKNKKPSKKDHHSKIHTTQGPRDRRHNLAVSNDSSSKFTNFPRFTDVQRFRSIGGPGEPTAGSDKDPVIHINKLSN
ncbi:hypothetical protein L1987_44093 [Smallanthus sonchifolius]|uniref:Uncharacterized protein n=1 Tax=Smallanthus sonchifolius TaxID=185202 RepID=A0ACB9GPT0_9ASTR|nr:hypothetical protein L1987_44093 [Smallanthus sonchifolius]